ncbi:MAG: signal transduction protein, partial [Anaerovibrio slackiae]|nr:signal transduction protein [Anaerovibrio slackiae]
KIGVVKELAGIIADAGFNIDSMVTCKQASLAGHFEIVIRVDADNVEEITAKIEEKGYNVVHVAKIG